MRHTTSSSHKETTIQTKMHNLGEKKRKRREKERKIRLVLPFSFFFFIDTHMSAHQDVEDSEALDDGSVHSDATTEDPNATVSYTDALLPADQDMILLDTSTDVSPHVSVPVKSKNKSTNSAK